MGMIRMSSNSTETNATYQTGVNFVSCSSSVQRFIADNYISSQYTTETAIVMAGVAKISVLLPATSRDVTSVSQESRGIWFVLMYSAFDVGFLMYNIATAAAAAAAARATSKGVYPTITTH